MADTATAAHAASDAFFSCAQLLEHWQGHRRLTRRVIEAFPDDQLFSYSVGGMRTFGAMASEMLNMAVPTVEGVATGTWQDMNSEKPTTKADVLRLWDESTAALNKTWPTLSADKMQEVVTAFGQWTMPVHALVLYVVDNEIHHRGQGYVYLRTLGIEPPPFWERENVQA